MATEAVLAQPQGVARGARGARRATPALLTTWAAALCVLIALSGLLMELAVSSRHRAVNSALHTSAPLLVNAQNVYTGLSDADTTAAGAFLVGTQQPVALRARYQADLARAAASLSAAAEEAAGNDQLSRTIQLIATELPTYSGLVETARANSRLGYPVGASYLNEASNLMRTEMLPAASRLYTTERARLESDRSGATAIPALLAGEVILLLTLVVLLVLHQWMSTRFRRTFSPPLVAALLVAVIAGGWVAAASVSQNSNAKTAKSDGTTPLSAFTQARILGLQARADDELTLVTRDSVPAYQTDFSQITGQLGSLLKAAKASAGAADRSTLNDAQLQLSRELAAHRRIRADDTSGNLTAAIALATGAGSAELPAVAGRLDSVLTGGVSRAQARFNDEMGSAGSAVNGLTIAIPILCLLIAGLVVLAVRPRLAEYR